MRRCLQVVGWLVSWMCVLCVCVMECILWMGGGHPQISVAFSYAVESAVAIPPFLSGLFDTLDGSSMIDEAHQMTALLDSRVWTPLGVGPSLQLAINSWVHFRCGSSGSVEVWLMQG